MTIRERAQITADTIAVIADTIKYFAGETSTVYGEIDNALYHLKKAGFVPAPVNSHTDVNEISLYGLYKDALHVSKRYYALAYDIENNIFYDESFSECEGGETDGERVNRFYTIADRFDYIAVCINNVKNAICY